MRNFLFLFFGIFLCSLINAQEICNNGIDDDSDGLIDLNDPECICNGLNSLVPSFIPNPSFEMMNCCPSDMGQLACAGSWTNATAGTADYFNTCGYVSNAATTLSLSPPPDGNGFAGLIFSNSNSEYLGSCLTTPLVAGMNYIMQMNIASSYVNSTLDYVGPGAPPPVNITIYGTTNCSNLPDITTGCPGINWFPIAVQSYTPVNNWGLINFNFTPPVNVDAIMIGAPCVLPVGYGVGSNLEYFYFDNLIINNASAFNLTSIQEVNTTGGADGLPASVCANNLALVATADSVGGSWQWYKNGMAMVGQTTATLTISANGYGAGNYSARYTIGSKCDISFKNITATKPIVNFTFANTCLNSTTSFSSMATASSGISSQTWSFGDGTHATGVSPSHLYGAVGPYNVKLVVKDVNQCKDSLAKSISIYPNPVVGISSNTVCLNSNTTFTNTSSIAAPDNIATWAWDFDSNGTIDDASQFPSVIYASAGTYIAELVAISNHGCADSSSIPVLVKGRPSASFVTPNACLNTTSNVLNTSSIAAPDVISMYDWQFGANASLLNSSSANPAISYSISGTHTITLTVTANVTCSATVTHTVTIYPQPVADFSVTSVCAFKPSVFSDLSAPVGAIVDWEWDFNQDNGIDDVIQNPSHTYPSPGNYTTSLIVTSSNNCKDTVSKTVTVHAYPVVSFSADTVCFDKVTLYTNNSSISAPDNIATWAWDFNTNGSVDSSMPSASVIFGSAGTYTSQLKAISNHGCADSLRRVVLVNALPIASFSASNACLNTTLTLNNTSSVGAPDNIAACYWQFGNGSFPVTSSLMQPAPSYSTSGIQTITLTVMANTTCSATVTKTVSIYPQPVANFSVTSVCKSAASVFTDLSTSVGSVVGWQWDFNGDHIIDNTTHHPSYTYSSSGTFTASLVAISNTNCKDTVSLPVTVWGHAVPNFSADTVCFGSVTSFTNSTSVTSQANTGALSVSNWDFADSGSSSTLLHPGHTFTTAANGDATYSVTLKVTTSHGCVDSVKKPVYVYAIPSASFVSDSACLGFVTHFADNSNGHGHVINSYQWDFLSNSTIDAVGTPTTTFTFPAPGNNALSYTVTTNPLPILTCSSHTTTLPAWVNPMPVADFTFVSKCINVQPVPLDASFSSIAIGTNTLYSWQYGDGAVGNGLTTGHSYAAAAPYTVTLTVVSDKGCRASTSKQLEVYEKPHMAVANSAACDRQAMTFTATTQPGSGTIINWFWDFNNSISTIEANGQNVNFILPAAGIQTVALVSETDHWCRDTLKKTVYVDYLPVPSFTVDKQAGCPLPHCVEFTNTTLPLITPGQNNGWKWYFGDGTMLTANSGGPQKHCYTNASSSQLATYGVKLVVSTDKGCSDSLSLSNFITVYPKPLADYVAVTNPGNVVTPLVDFTNQSLDFTKWWLSFGDGPEIDSLHLNPTHYYVNDDGETYKTVLIVSNQYNCMDTAYLPVTITPDFAFYIPNAFSPQNGDGVNDVFSAKGIGIKTYEMWVFDLWGGTIYYTNDIEKGWDGTVKNTGSLAKEGIYVWKVILQDVLGKPHEYAGHVTLFK